MNQFELQILLKGLLVAQAAMKANGTSSDSIAAVLAQEIINHFQSEVTPASTPTTPPSS